MDAIELTGHDAARITLALIADKMDTTSEMRLGQLQTHWRELGLRADDLIQGLSTLGRNEQLRIEGQGENATLVIAEDTGLPRPGKGISTLEPRLQTILEQAGERKSRKRKTDKERREGFK